MNKCFFRSLVMSLVLGLFFATVAITYNSFSRLENDIIRQNDQNPLQTRTDSPEPGISDSVVGPSEQQHAIQREQRRILAVIILLGAGIVFLIRRLTNELIRAEREKARIEEIAPGFAKTEEELRREADLLKTIFDTIPLPIYFKNREGVVLGRNTAMEMMLEVPTTNSNELNTSGEAHMEPTHEGWLSDLELINQGGTQVCETALIHVENGVRNVEIHKAAFKMDDGAMAGMVGTIIDVTEQKWAQENLRTVNQQLKNIIDFLPDATFVIGQTKKVVAWNRAIQEMTGISESEILGEGNYTYSLPFYGERRPILIDLIDASAGEINARYDSWEKRGDSLYAERHIRHIYGGRGGVIWAKATPLYDRDGNRVGAIESIRDITERKKSEDALLASEKKYKELSREFQTLLNGIPAPIMLLSPEMKLIWANEGAARKLGMTVGTLPGQCCHSLWNHRSTPCRNCPVSTCFSSGNSEKKVLITGEGRHLEVNAFPLKDKDGRPTRVICVVNDITDRIRLQDESMRKSHLESLGELAAGMAHEINNPNAIILLNSEFIEQVFADAWPALDAHGREEKDFTLGGLAFDEARVEIPLMLSEMNDGARRIKRIVDDLKEFVRPTGPFAEPVDLNAIIQTACRLAAVEIKKSTDRFVTTYALNLPKINGSIQAMTQVAINLITNACQSLPDRDKGIYVSTWFDKVGQMCLFEVRDEGCGILPENMPKLTDPFFTTKRKTGGTGLGLSISSRIVKAHGGELEITSCPGKGTTVRVALPLRKKKPKTPGSETDALNA